MPFVAFGTLGAAMLAIGGATLLASHLLREPAEADNGGGGGGKNVQRALGGGLLRVQALQVFMLTARAVVLGVRMPVLY
eukprot:SAG11_NODE_3217_length_2604_cov_1.697006_4_plen_79_part_00